MRATKLVKWLGLAVLVASTVACTGDTLDDGDSADVVLEVVSLDSPSVEGTFDEEDGGCDISVTDWVVTFENKPKNALAITSPANDVVVETVTITYTFLDGNVVPTTTFGLADVVVFANETNSVNFPPIALTYVSAAQIPGTAHLGLVFRGRTVENEVITVVTSAVLQFGGDC